MCQRWNLQRCANSYYCLCAAGYSGIRCETDVNECTSQPCTNGGTCTDLPNGFTCACVSGFSGWRCQTDINECSSNPCLTGICVDLVNGYSCACPTGLTGPACDIDVNECATNNGGCLSTCNNAFGTYNCSAVLVPVSSVVGASQTLTHDPLWC